MKLTDPKPGEVLGPCWLWPHPYGSARRGPNAGKVVHRLIYEAVNGPVPAGKVLDHLCETKRCCNPDHLEPVWPHENTLRSLDPSRRSIPSATGLPR